MPGKMISKYLVKQTAALKLRLPVQARLPLPFPCSSKDEQPPTERWMQVRLLSGGLEAGATTALLEGEWFLPHGR